MRPGQTGDLSVAQACQTAERVGDSAVCRNRGAEELAKLVLRERPVLVGGQVVDLLRAEVMNGEDAGVGVDQSLDHRFAEQCANHAVDVVHSLRSDLPRGAKIVDEIGDVLRSDVCERDPSDSRKNVLVEPALVGLPGPDETTLAAVAARAETVTSAMKS